ncbi:MAG: peptidylprolyl isomerase [Desulfobacterales bacterium]|nr:peptidylprolyl isomerase [Desulfobacterales bacterium]
METVQNELYVSVSYTGTLDNGEVFDTSEGRGPMEVQMGNGQLIEGFERELMGMAVGEKKTFTVSAAEAYGERDEEATLDIAVANVPPGMDPQVGQTVGMTTSDGHQVPGLITAVTEEHVSVDMNHPMAGKALTFAIEVTGISETPTQEPSSCGSDCGCDCGSGCC